MARLFAALDLPEKYTCSQGTVSTGFQFQFQQASAAIVLLRRFAYQVSGLTLSDYLEELNLNMSQ
jgi:hypothetical protein